MEQKLPDELKKKELKKATEVVQIGGNLTEAQRKAYNSLLYLAQRELKNRKVRNTDVEYPNVFYLPAPQVKELCGLDWKNKDLIEELSKLAKVQVHYNILKKNKKGIRGFFNLISEARIDKETKKLMYAFPPTVIRTILNPEMFCLLDLKVIKGLKSKYAIVLFENVKNYSPPAEFPEISIEDFRELMGVENKYSDFAQLKRRVINPAIKEINEKTDLYVSYKITQKFGMKVEWLKFFVDYAPTEEQAKFEKDHRQPSLFNPQKTSKTDIFIDEICEKIMVKNDKGLRGFIVNSLKDGIAEGSIREVASYVADRMRTGNIENPARYFITVMNAEREMSHETY